jgi:hypothetical protein
MTRIQRPWLFAALVLLAAASGGLAIAVLLKLV